MTFDDPSVEAIARLLGAELRQAPFEVPKLPPGVESLSAGGRSQPPTERAAPVYQLTMHSGELGQPLLVTLWPSLGRVDVRLGRSYWALKGVTSVELYPGVEVLFRRDDPQAFLFISVQGRVALVA